MSLIYDLEAARWGITEKQKRAVENCCFFGFYSVYFIYVGEKRHCGDLYHRTKGADPSHGRHHCCGLHSQAGYHLGCGFSGKMGD